MANRHLPPDFRVPVVAGASVPKGGPAAPVHDARAVMCVMVTGSAISALAWFVETAAGVITPWDRWLIPMLSVVFAAAALWMKLRPERLIWAGALSCLTLNAYFVVSTLLVFHATPDATHLYQLFTGLYWMPLGYASAFIILPTRVAVVVSAVVYACMYVSLGLALQTPQGQAWGSEFAALVGITALAQVAYIVVLVVVATMRAGYDRARERLRVTEELVNTDLLTGLPNRGLLRDVLARDLASNPLGESVALLCLDLDRFKPVNDTYGHAAGDELLRQVAKRLRECVRGVDVVARLGGDEFAVLQRHAVQPEGSTRLARRIIDVMSQPFEVDGHVVHVGTSVGVAVAPGDGQDSESLLRHADLALYRAKSDGRGQLVHFQPNMNQRVEARRGLENAMREALLAQEFELAYQPRFGEDDQRPIAVEALLRWNHPQRGAISPGEFVPLAEETGLIVPIGRFVLERACRDALAWPAHTTVAVNVSVVQFTRGTLVADVTHALAASGLPPQRLELEITESTMIKDPTRVLSVLHTLRSRGVRIATDDFGTGFSSLSHLRSFPFDHLKIDRSFVREVVERKDLQAIIRGIVTLARGMGMQTTAEGVETAEQLALVRALGCDAIQGFLLGRPVPAAQIGAWMHGAGESTDDARHREAHQAIVGAQPDSLSPTTTSRNGATCADDRLIASGFAALQP